jgi:uncharacterized protein (DUF1800 family)
MSISFQTMAALRFGYGFRASEAAPRDKQALLEQIGAGAGIAPLFPIGGIDARRQQIGEIADRLHDIRSGTASDDGKRGQQNAVFKVMDQTYQRDVDARIAQAVFSPFGFHERLAGFWTNHFSVSAQKNQPMRLIVPLFEAEVIRPNIGAKFPDLLRAVMRHPAMLIYLDQSESLGPDSPAGIKRNKGLNENLARELIELHTLGAGSGYTQDDVRSAAMVLTGIAVDQRAVTADFRPGIAEPGSHRVLGFSYGGKRRTEQDYLSLLDDLALNPKTAQHICRKLAVHFIADAAPNDMVAAMADCWKNTDGDLQAIYATMLDHPAAWSGEGAKARQPFDFVVAGLRALNLEKNPAAGTPAPLSAALNADDASPMMSAVAPAAQGPMAAQVAPPMQGPAPSAAVLPGAAAGSTSMSPAMSSDASKQQQAAFDATFYVPPGLGLYGLRRMGQPTWQPPSPAGFPEGFDAWIDASALAERISWAHRAIGRYGKQYDPRQFLKDTLSDAAREDTIRVVSQAPNRMTGLTLVLASPEFNRC